MKFDSSEIYALETGTFKLDGGAMFGTVPKPIWEKAIPPDGQNRIPMALRVILLKDSKQKRNLIVDTGIGEKWTEKMVGIYAIDHSQDSLEKNLAKHGLKPEDITDVILTHLHFDHTGGSTKEISEGKFVPTFPNAKYYVQKDNFDWATAPNSREAASYLPQNFMPLVDSKQLVICNGVQEFEKAIHWPGITVRLSYGHTIGLQCPLISLGNRKFFYPSDMIPTASHIPVPWVMGYDIHVIKLLEEKEALLEEAVRDQWIFIYEHDPVSPATGVLKGKKHFERGPVVQI
ncbi:MAG: fold metallo-hydrolase [Bacteriovoracaceae bacterium]|nr:fold metallo-hydrolase [Bacteriovoracaceae bacterium]